MPELRRDRAADGRYYLGVTGTGKTWQTKRDIRAYRGRVRVWDWKDDHHELRAVTLAQLAREALVSEPLRVLPDFTTDIDRQFDLFCRIVWAAQEADPRTDCLFVAEELSEVTKPSWAPPAWRRINVQGRAFGFSIIGTTQRPAFVDKSFTTNATVIRCGRLGDVLDARVMSQRLGVPVVELQRLPDRWAYVFDGRKTELQNPRGKAVSHVRATAAG